MGSFLLALSLVLAGTQNPKDLPGPDYQYPVSDPWGVWEPGSGGGGAGTNSYNCAWVTDCSYVKDEDGKKVKYERWCVSYTIPGQPGSSHNYCNPDRAEVNKWVGRNCKK